MLKTFILYQASIVLAFLFDLIFGDPRKFPHPVKFIGFLASKFEPFFRKKIKNEKIAGTFFAVSIILVTLILTSSLVIGFYFINIYLSFFIAFFLIYTAIAYKDLKIESLKVLNSLKNNNIVEARKNLSMIVGRDTQNLNEDEIIRATVETIAENLVDGILSPIFYAFAGNAIFTLIFKAVSTLDSTVGYKNEKYKYFGTASAKIDDILNFIPARISLILIPIASFICKKDWKNSLKIALRDRNKNPSPNSGIPEAAFAGALGISLGGLNFYNKIPVYKPKIGDAKKDLDQKDIIDALKITTVSTILFIFFCIALFNIIFALIFLILMP